MRVLGFIALLALLSGCGTTLSGISVTGTATIPRGPCVGFTATALDSAGAAVSISDAVTVALSGGGSGTFHESFDACAKNVAVTSTTIAAGAQSKSLYFKDYTAETLTLTATAAGKAGTLAVSVVDKPFAVASAFDSDVTTIDVTADGKVLAGGYFGNHGSTARAASARLNADGTLDTTYVPETLNNSLRSVMNDPSDPTKALLAGFFSTVGVHTMTGLSRATAAGAYDTFLLSTGVDVGVWKLAKVPSSTSKIYAGGYFTTYNSTSQGGMTRLNLADGSIDTFIQGTGFTLVRDGGSAVERGGPPTVSSIVPLADGRVYVGGAFLYYNTTAAAHVARLTAAGALDTFTQGTGFSSNVSAMALATDGSEKLYVSGDFTTYNGNAAVRIARLNTDGTLDGTFDTGGAGQGFNNPAEVIAPALDGSGRIYVGGSFSTYRGAAVPGIARLNADGTLDTTFNAGNPGPSRGTVSLLVHTIVVVPDGSGRIVIGGNFSHYNGADAQHIARLSREGALE